MSNKLPPLVENDPWLKPFADQIISRRQNALNKEKELLAGTATLKDFALGHLFFGLHRTPDGWVFREWAPNATAIFLTGTFNSWMKDDPGFLLERVHHDGIWEIHLPHDALHHGDLFKLLVYWDGGSGERIPAWARRVVQDEHTKIFSAQVWDPAIPYSWKHPGFTRPAEPVYIYEAHVGMATEEYKVGSYEEFRLHVLPRIISAGYNTLQLMAIQEHPYYGSFGYHVSSLFAPSSRFGTPEELKALIDAAHEAGMAVIMDLVHSHAVRNEAEGLGRFDGTTYQYFHDGPRREHVAWDSLCYNYAKNEVLHFLLSNCAFWLGEYKFDGFRMDGITSMLYLDHGLSRNFTSLDMYYDANIDQDAIAYLMLASKLVHEIRPDAAVIAEDMSGMPGLAAPFEEGGFGFDYRLAMGIPDYWIKMVKELPDEKWNVNNIFFELTNRRKDEKAISYCESHDQALVGDQTLIFRLLDKEMYFQMANNMSSVIMDRGIALHKMLRLITLATAGAGYLNFMGNEFGHPEWIDFPREGNNWSYHYARRQWSLSDNGLLRYHFLGEFDREMIKLIRKHNCLKEPFPYKTFDQEENQVLAFTRADLLFVFNFNPERSFVHYGVKTSPGKYRVVLDTDSKAFGGFGRIDDSLLYFTKSLGKLATGSENVLELYLPNRVGLVFQKVPTRRVR